MAEELRAPLIYFGGKRRVANIVWRALGPGVDHYVEPFFGSGAVLLGRIGNKWHTGMETVNDLDGFVVNFWRAMAADPEQVASYCDYPVTEVDLTARHLWLVNTGAARIKKLEVDPDYFDAKVAGWWVWGINIWIGSGWCSGDGCWALGEESLTKLDHDRKSRGGQHAAGDSRRMPSTQRAQGINKQSIGVSKHLPFIGGGRGVNKQLIALNHGQGINRDAWNGLDGKSRLPALIRYFNTLSHRLRRVRICCGDWQRILTEGALSAGSTTGIFFDPPYSESECSEKLYRTKTGNISKKVRRWAVEHGDDPKMRIVLAGYRDEHDHKIPATWRRHFYSAGKCYGRSHLVGSGTGNDANRHKETLWFSPFCIDQRPSLLDTI